MDNSGILTMLFPFIVGLAIFFILYRRFKKLRKGVTRANQKGFPLTSTKAVCVTPTRPSIRYRYLPPVYNKGGEQRPPGIEFSAPCSLPAFRLSLETKKDAFFARLGFLRRLPFRLLPGFVLQSPEPEALARLMQDARVSTHLQVLLGHFTDVASDGRTITAVCSPYRESLEVPELSFQDTIAEALEALKSVSPLQTPNRPGLLTRLGLGRILSPQSIQGVAILAIAACGIAGAAAHSFYDVVFFSDIWELWLSSAGAGIFLAAAFYRTQGPSLCLTGSKWLVVTVMSVCWIVGISFVGIVGANGFFDTSPAQVVAATVVSSESSRSRRKKRYYAHVVLPSEDRSFRLWIPFLHYQHIQRGTKLSVEVKLRKGALGIRWIEEYRLPRLD